MKLSVTARSLGIVLLLLLCATAVSAQSTTLAPQRSVDSSVAPCDRYGLPTVVRCIGHDLSGIVKGSSRRWLEVGGVLAGGSLLLDDEVVAAMAKPDKSASFEFAEFLGDAGMQFGVPAALYLVARATGSEGAQDVSIMLLRTQTVNGIVTRGLKLLPRPRPYQETATPTKGSFPSGHTSAAFATATVLQRKFGLKAGLPAYAVATFIGTSRLQNVHYLSDVTFGAALGIASGLVMNVPGHGPAITPVIAPGKVGLSISIGGRP